MLDPRRRTLSRAGSSVSLTPKAYDVLLFLVQNPNRLITKEELLQAVWGDAFVEEGNLTQYISHLRKALGDNSLIVTIARKGYQFAGDVVFSPADPATQGEGRVPVIDRPRTDAASSSDFPGTAAASGTPKSSRKVVVALRRSLFWRWWATYPSCHGGTISPRHCPAQER